MDKLMVVPMRSIFLVLVGAIIGFPWYCSSLPAQVLLHPRGIGNRLYNNLDHSSFLFPTSSETAVADTTRTKPNVIGVYQVGISDGILDILGVIETPICDEIFPIANSDLFCGKRDSGRGETEVWIGKHDGKKVSQTHSVCFDSRAISIGPLRGEARFVVHVPDKNERAMDVFNPGRIEVYQANADGTLVKICAFFPHSENLNCSGIFGTLVGISSSGNHLFAVKGIGVPSVWDIESLHDGPTVSKNDWVDLGGETLVNEPPESVRHQMSLSRHWMGFPQADVSADGRYAVVTLLYDKHDFLPEIPSMLECQLLTMVWDLMSSRCIWVQNQSVNRLGDDDPRMVQDDGIPVIFLNGNTFLVVLPRQIHRLEISGDGPSPNVAVTGQFPRHSGQATSVIKTKDRVTSETFLWINSRTLDKKLGSVLEYIRVTAN